MATAADIDADLTFEIDGDAVTPEVFQRTVSAFFDLLAEVGRTVSPKGERIEWRVQVKQGSNLIGLRPAPGAPPGSVARVRAAIIDGLTHLDREASEPAAFNETSLKHVRKLSSALNNAGKSPPIMRVWGENSPVTISDNLSHNVTQILGEAYADHGSVEGQLKTVSSASGYRVVVYEPIFGRPIRCDLPAELLDQALKLFEQRVEVHGILHYRRDGQVARVVAEEIIPFPAAADIPNFEEVRGILGRIL